MGAHGERSLCSGCGHSGLDPDAPDAGCDRTTGAADDSEVIRHVEVIAIKDLQEGRSSEEQRQPTEAVL